MADLKDKMAKLFNEYAQAQNSFIEQGVKIINDFLRENSINKIDFTEINDAHYKAFYDDLKEDEISYEHLMDLYNATRRRLYYCSYVYEHMIIDNEDFDESDIPKMKIMLETCEGHSEVNDNLKVYANMYDEECGFEEYK